MAGQFVVSMKLEGDAGSLKSAADEGAQAIGGLGKTARDAGTALDTYSAQLDKTAASGQRAVQAANDAAATERNLRSSIDNMLGIGTSGRNYQQAANDVAAYGQSLDELRAKYNPVFAASKQYEAELADLDQALKVGALTAQEHDAALSDLNGRYTLATTSSQAFREATVAATGALSLNRIQMMEATHVGREFLAMVAMGVSPMQAFSMEAGRIATFFSVGDEGASGTFKSLAKGAGGVLGTVTNVLGVVPTIGIAFAGVSALAVAAFQGIDTHVVSSEDALKEYKSVIDEIGKASQSTGDKIKAMLDQPRSFSTISADTKQAMDDIRSNLNGQFRQMEATARSFSSESQKLMMSANPMEAYQSGFSTDGIFRSIDAADQKIGKLIDSVTKGKMSAKDALAELNKLSSANTYPPSLDALLRNLRQVFEQAVKDQQQLGSFYPDLGKTDRPTPSNQVRDAVRATSLADKLREQTKQLYGVNTGPQSQQEALKALSQAQEGIKEASLQGYARQLATINFQIEQQIKLNPDAAATWRQVGQAQKEALAISTGHQLLDQQNQTIASLKAEAEAANLGTVAYDKLMAAISAKNDIERAGVAATSKIGETYVENAKDIAALTDQVSKQKDAWSTVRNAGADAMNGLTDILTEKQASISDILGSIASEIEKTFVQLAITNPFENALFGTNGGTLSDLSGGAGIIGHFLGSVFGGSSDPWAGLRTVSPGFAVGGYTGDIAPSSIAGYVHGKEYVFDAVSTRMIGPSNLEAMRRNALRGYSEGGYVSSERPWLNGSAANSQSSGPIVQVIDQRSNDAPPVQTTVSTDANGNKKVSLLIRKTIQDETLTSGRKTNRGLKSMGLQVPVVKR